MVGKKRKIILTDFDHRLLVALLVDYRNKLLNESSSTEYVNELLLKLLTLRCTAGGGKNGKVHIQRKKRIAELIGDYYYPCLTDPESPCIGICGMRRLQYLKEHKKILYQTLFYTEKLKAHLEEIDHSA